MKRSTQIGLAAAGVVMVATYWSLSGGESEDSLVYSNLAECRAANQLSTSQCEQRFNEASANHLREAKKFTSSASCEQEFGSGGCQSAVWNNAQVFIPALAGIMLARGWPLGDKLSMLKVAVGWQLKKFQCAPGDSVADLCRGLAPGAMAALIEPLCVSALNTPAQRASGQVFLRVMRDALFAESGGSNLLLPRTDLSALLPDAALAWLSAQGNAPRLGARVQAIAPAGSGWVVSTDTSEAFDCVVLACPPHEAARLVEGSGVAAGDWLAQAQELQYEALTTVYAWAPGARLELPMLALPANAAEPAQFVFDRGQLSGPPGLLAFVISASTGDSATLTAQVLAQAKSQLWHLGLGSMEAVQTIVEKRATFACTPGLQRPRAEVAPGLYACGDYIAGPYPATLEGAVRSGLEAARHLH